MTAFWLAVGMAALVLLAAVPGAIGIAALLIRMTRGGRFVLPFALTLALAFAYSVVVTAGAVWLAGKWGIE